MKTRRQKGRGTTLPQHLREEMKDAEFQRLYQEADIELRVALEITKAREVKHMSQQELADALKMKQQTVSRIERGAQNVTIALAPELADRIRERAKKRLIALRLPRWQKSELDQRKTKFQKNLKSASSWEDVKNKIQVSHCAQNPKGWKSRLKTT